MVPPFSIRRLNRSFAQTDELRIDLAVLPPDIYRIVAVQNFWIEDHNPDLAQALAGIFLARRRTDGVWEEPENWPVECRTLATLGHVDTRRPDRIEISSGDHEH